MIPVERLSHLKVFEKTAPAALQRLAATMVAKTIQAGEIICREGEAGPGLFLIASGSVDVMKKIGSVGDAAVKVAHLEAEEFFGEMAFLEQAPLSATVTAKDTTEIFLLERQQIDRLMKQDPSIALDQMLTLFSGLSMRLRQTTSQLVALFEVSRIIGTNPDPKQLFDHVIKLIHPNFGPTSSLAFYLYNPFNEEDVLMSSAGPETAQFSPVIDQKDPFFKLTTQGFATVDNLLISPIENSGKREGLFLCAGSAARQFDHKHIQLMETLSAVLAPALSGARAHEEEKARQQLARAKQGQF